MNAEERHLQEQNSTESLQGVLVTNDEILEAHEEIYKSGFPMKVDETSEEYSVRINASWEQEKERLIADLEKNQDPVQEKVITKEVRQWLAHPLIEEYAHRYQAGENIDDLLEGQKNIEEKGEAIKILASNLIPIEKEVLSEMEQKMGTEAKKEPEENELHTPESTLVGEGIEHSKAYAQAQKYIEKIKQTSKHPEMQDVFLETWKDPQNSEAMNEFLINTRYKEYREVDYPIEPDYNSIFEYANTNDIVPHKNENGWVYRGVFPTQETGTKTRGSLNIHVTQECIQELDALISQGLFVGNYKFGEPNTPAEASERHDAITLYFLEEPSEELQTALTTIAQKHYRAGSLLGKEIAPGFSMSEVESINEDQIKDLLEKLTPEAPELAQSIEKYVTRRPKDGQPKKLAMSEAQYYAIKDTLALYDLALSIDADGAVVLEEIQTGSTES